MYKKRALVCIMKRKKGELTHTYIYIYIYICIYGVVLILLDVHTRIRFSFSSASEGERSRIFGQLQVESMLPIFLLVKILRKTLVIFSAGYYNLFIHIYVPPYPVYVWCFWWKSHLPLFHYNFVRREKRFHSNTGNRMRSSFSDTRTKSF